MIFVFIAFNNDVADHKWLIAAGGSKVSARGKTVVTAESVTRVVQTTCAATNIYNRNNNIFVHPHATGGSLKVLVTFYTLEKEDGTNSLYTEIIHQVIIIAFSSFSPQFFAVVVLNLVLVTLKGSHNIKFPTY